MRTNAGQNPLVYLFSKTWRYSSGNRKNIMWFWVMFIMANSITLFVVPLIWAKIINIITEQGVTSETIRTLLTLLASILLVDIVFWSLHGPARLLERSNAFKARVNYRKYLVDGVMSLPMGWHVHNHSGKSIDRIEKGTGALFRFSEGSFEVIYAIVQLVGSYIMLIYFSSSSSYIVVVMMMITVWITLRFDKVLIGQYKELNERENDIAESVFDAISNITTIIVLRVERLIVEAIIQKVEKPYKLFTRNNSINEFKWFLTSVCTSILTIWVLGAYFLEHVGTRQGILVGSVYLLINYLDKINTLFFKFTSMYGEILQQKGQVLNTEELAASFVASKTSSYLLPSEWGTLEVRDLTFSYSGNGDEALHLDNVSLDIKRGKRIAFIGETGSGKTTCLKVIRNLHDSQELKLLVDGSPVPDGFQAIAYAIALVPQTPELFATTILENITLGAEYDMDLVQRYMDMACFTSVLEGLPGGLETRIGERGVNLSGGQQQRLALVRGLLASHDKDIILLDEPTSNLDAGTEMDVYKNIFEYIKKTIIATVHRLHLLHLFDIIYFFEEGRIVGCGTLAELLASNTHFQELWRKSQAVHEE